MTVPQRLSIDLGSARDFAERAFAAGCIAALAPVLATTALAIKATSKGPVLHQSPRLGKEGRIFLMKKFRSMQPGTTPIVTADAKTVVEHDDPRLTPIGRFLRIGFDELPQLFNIATGDMRFIGPRPDAPWMEPRYTPAIRERLAAKPGVVGLAQVLDSRALPTQLGYMLDVFYVRNQGILLDALILALTPFYVSGWKRVGHWFLDRIITRPDYSPEQFEPLPTEQSTATYGEP